MEKISLWGGFWSHTQDSFHIEEVAQELRTNREMFERHAPNDFVLLALGASHQEVQEKLRPLEEIRDARRAVQEGET